MWRLWTRMKMCHLPLGESRSGARPAHDEVAAAAGAVRDRRRRRVRRAGGRWVPGRARVDRCSARSCRRPRRRSRPARRGRFDRWADGRRGGSPTALLSASAELLVIEGGLRLPARASTTRIRGRDRAGRCDTRATELANQWGWTRTEDGVARPCAELARPGRNRDCSPAPGASCNCAEQPRRHGQTARQRVPPRHLSTSEKEGRAQSPRSSPKGERGAQEGGVPDLAVTTDACLLRMPSTLATPLLILGPIDEERLGAFQLEESLTVARWSCS